MNKLDIEKYLRMPGQELLQQQVTGEILLAGGAVRHLAVTCLTYVVSAA